MSGFGAGPPDRGRASVAATASGSLPTLKRRAEFLAVAKGVRHHGGAFTVQANTAALKQPRIGYTVTKAAGSSPERNRIRRRLRAAVRCLAVEAPVADFVVVGRRDLLSIDFRDLTNRLSEAMSRTAGKLNRPAPAEAQKAQD